MFNNNIVKVLQLNGTSIWQYKAYDWVDGDDRFYYTGIDENGIYEDMLGYTGVPVEYALGKRTMKAYLPVSPTPTTASGYVGYFIDLPNGKTHITSEEDATTRVENNEIILGSTIAYKYEDVKSVEGVITQDDIVYGYPDCNAYNVHYYAEKAGFVSATDFFNSNSLSNITTQYVESILTIPNRYKNRPIKRILRNAFKNGESSDASTAGTYNQSRFVKEIRISEGITHIHAKAFYRCDLGANSSKFLVLPETTIYLANAVFGDARVYVDLPKGLQNGLGQLSYQGGGNCIYRCKSLSVSSTQEDSTSTVQGFLDYFNTVIFEKTAEVIRAGLFYNSAAKVLVFKHDADAQITFNVTSLKAATSITVYTDNEIIKNFDWASKNYTVTFKALSEYVEG